MAKSKKELLANRQKVGRPSLRRKVVTDTTREADIVQRVADNPPAVPTLASPLPSAVPAPAAAPPKPERKASTARKSAAKKTSAKAKAGKPAAAPAKEAYMRMTFDVPKSLHLKLKMHALQNGVTIKAHMLRIIEESIR